jgi:hypothetical protein
VCERCVGAQPAYKFLCLHVKNVHDVVDFAHNAGELLTCILGSAGHSALPM